MRVERSIGTGPRRSTEQACVSIAQFVAKVLADRAYPDAAKAASSLEKLFPLLRFLFSTRKFAEPAITITMPGLQVDLLVSYSPQFEEDLTPPDVVLLDALSADDLIHIEVHSTEDVGKPLRDLPASASPGNVRFSLTHGPGSGPPADAAAGPADVPATDEPPADVPFAEDPFPDLATSDAAIPGATRPDETPAFLDVELPGPDGIVPDPQRDDDEDPRLIPNSRSGDDLMPPY